MEASPGVRDVGTSRAGSLWVPQAGAMALGASRLHLHRTQLRLLMGWDERGGAEGLVRPRERDGGAAAVPALWDPCHGGFTTGSCCMGTAPVGRAERGGTGAAAPQHGLADPALAPVPWCSLTHTGDAAVGTDFTPRRGLDLGARSPPAALHINPPGSSCRPAGRRRAGPALQTHPRLAAWSWCCQRPGWLWRRAAGSRRRHLRSKGQGWRGCSITTISPSPMGSQGRKARGDASQCPISAALVHGGPPNPGPHPRHSRWKPIHQAG